MSLTQDFDLALGSGQRAGAGRRRIRERARPTEPTQPTVAIARNAIELDDAAGVGTLSSVLVGRVAGLRVSPASVPGGSAQLVFRGPRSALGSNQPLFVVDGLPMTSTVFASAAQRFGLGGFDYGSPIDDIDLASVESVRFLSAGEAAAAYGGRGANGVVLVTTKVGSGRSAFRRWRDATCRRAERTFGFRLYRIHMGRVSTASSRSSTAAAAASTMR